MSRTNRDEVATLISKGLPVSDAVQQFEGQFFIKDHAGYRFPDGSELILFSAQSEELSVIQLTLKALSGFTAHLQKEIRNLHEASLLLYRIRSQSQEMKSILHRLLSYW